MANIILDSSSASRCKLSNISIVIKSVSLSRFNQYFNSKDSLYAIEIFAEKSAVEIAPLASATFAPIEVPQRKNCFDKTYSFLLFTKYLYALTMRIERAKAFGYNISSLIDSDIWLLLTDYCTLISNCRTTLRPIEK